MKEVIGACRFCGQTKLVRLADEASDEMADQAATNECNCQEAAQYRASINKMARIRDTIESTFDEETSEFMMSAVDAVVSGMFDRITIDVHEMKFTLYINNDGKLVFGRRRTIKSREEF